MVVSQKIENIFKQNPNFNLNSEPSPYIHSINKKKYTVAKKDMGLKVPEGFIKTKIVIDKQEVVGYSNSFTGYLIIALVDEDGNAGWYIYNQKNGTFTKYFEFTSKSIVLKSMVFPSPLSSPSSFE